jgi:hypothetical protein
VGLQSPCLASIPRLAAPGKRAKIAGERTPGGFAHRHVSSCLHARDLDEVSRSALRDPGASQLDGLGGNALAAFEADSEHYRLVRLRSGDFGFEILAPSEEGAQRLARLILERLPADG